MSDFNAKYLLMVYLFLLYTFLFLQACLLAFFSFNLTSYNKNLKYVISKEVEEISFELLLTYSLRLS